MGVRILAWFRLDLLDWGGFSMSVSPHRAGRDSIRKKRNFTTKGTKSTKKREIVGLTQGAEKLCWPVLVGAGREAPRVARVARRDLGLAIPASAAIKKSRDNESSNPH
jgi:hypothetical protein